MMRDSGDTGHRFVGLKTHRGGFGLRVSELGMRFSGFGLRDSVFRFRPSVSPIP